MDQNKQIQIERLGKKRHFIAFKNVKNLFVTVLILSDVYLPNYLLNNHFSISIRLFLVSYTCFSHVALNQNCNEQNFHIINAKNANQRAHLIKPYPVYGRYYKMPKK